MRHKRYGPVRCKGNEMREKIARLSVMNSELLEVCRMVNRHYDLWNVDKRDLIYKAMQAALDKYDNNEH
jgi:hypothetical protein